MDGILNPIGIEESLLVILLRNQPSRFDSWYQAEKRLAEKMKPARVTPVPCPHSSTTNSQG